MFNLIFSAFFIGLMYASHVLGIESAGQVAQVLLWLCTGALWLAVFSGGDEAHAGYRPFRATWMMVLDLAVATGLIVWMGAVWLPILFIIACGIAQMQMNLKRPATAR